MVTYQWILAIGKAWKLIYKMFSAINWRGWRRLQFDVSM